MTPRPFAAHTEAPSFPGATQLTRVCFSKDACEAPKHQGRAVRMPDGQVIGYVNGQGPSSGQHSACGVDEAVRTKGCQREGSFTSMTGLRMLVDRSYSLSFEDPVPTTTCAAASSSQGTAFG